MEALVFDRFGGPEALYIPNQPDPAPTAGQALARTRAIGLNSPTPSPGGAITTPWRPRAG